MSSGDTQREDLERALVRARVEAGLFGVTAPPVRLGRFELLRRLGAGGMGVVFQARDPERGETVALKHLRDVDARGVYRMKREFRALVDLAHPNLVRLYELFCEQGEWFFSMELIDGVGFDRWVRPDARAGQLDETRLRSALAQVLDAVLALHDAGKLHCDLKPSNVLVTVDGTVKLLDFGLVVERVDGASGPTGLAGTPAYMAPEQSAGEAPSPACDAYALGVMLFEALTGRRPFEGNPLRVLRDKQQTEAPDPRQLCEGLPDDLATLCVKLLERDPAARADLLAIRDVVMASDSRRLPAPLSTPPPWPALVGREAELSVLRGALSDVRHGAPVLLLVGGPSGIGKTALIEHFARQGSGEALVLRGRCHEHEALPYKAFDGVIDALARHLRRQAPELVAMFWPRHPAALLRLFPALGQVPALARAAERSTPAADSREARNQGFGALKELLTRLSDRGPLVLVVDDLQWGDADSARMLSHVLGAPEPPTLLFVGAYRSDEVESSPLLSHLLGKQPEQRQLEPRTLSLGPLTPDAAIELATDLLAEAATGLRAQSIAAEAQGVPFFIAELVQHMASAAQDRARALDGVTVDTLVTQRTETLEPEARVLLQVLSIAAAPLERAVAIDAAGLPAGDRATLACLRAGHLVRVRSTEHGELIETYHDRVRETVARSLCPELVRELHARIAAAMERNDVADAERLVVHYSGAGDAMRAGETAVQAAQGAADKLAFNRAAELYRRALELLPSESPQRRQLHERLGDALANAGRGAQAAEAYLNAAQGLEGPDARRLQRMAAQQYLRSGRVEEGMGLTQQLLTGVGLNSSSSPARTLAAFLWNRAVIGLRGLDRGPMPHDPVTRPLTIERADTLASVFREISVIDPLRGAALQSRYLREALDAGEPRRLLLGLAWEAFNSALLGGPTREKQATGILRRVHELSRQDGTPYAGAVANLATAGCEFFFAHFRSSLAPAERALVAFRDHCPGTSWEQNLLTTFRLGALEQTGSLLDIAREAPQLARDARERDDNFSNGFLALAVPAAHFMNDDPAAALGALEEQQRILPAGFTTLHLWVVHRTIDVFLYVNRGRDALIHYQQHWHAFKKSYVHRAQPLRVLGHWFLARAALGAAACGDPAALRIAQRQAAALENEGRSDALGWSLIARAGIARLQGSERVSRKYLEAAIAKCTDSEMDLFALYARRNLGLLIGGSEGTQIVDAVHHQLQLQGVRRPDLWASTYAPG